ncbi:MAG: hypothetical protein P4M11_07615 [Candidatus Pacebacteria bacterium]|nr:hypothetical protein [Candidatus Paceibacterota bacterium]
MVGLITLPYLFHVAMGIVVFLDEDMLAHTGVGIIALGWMVYSFFIALGHWYYKCVSFSSR